MNLAQLDTKVRRNLNDWAITYYNDSDVMDSTQDIYDEVVIYSECIERMIDLPVDQLSSTVGNAKPWVKIRELIPDYYRPIAILNRTTREFLVPELDRDNDWYRADWQNQVTGTVQNFVINGTEWIALPNGYYDVSHKPLRMLYKAQAPALNFSDGNEVFRILNEYQKLLEYGVTADLLEQNQEFTKAITYWNMYEPLLEEYRKKILLLSKSDQIFARMIQNC